MFKFIWILILLLQMFFTHIAFAKGESFVTVINPIRGGDFWDVEGQTPELAVSGQIEILKTYNISPTWLIRFDALERSEIINLINSSPSEKGLFLEVTPSWTSAIGVNYHKSENWHDAGSAFLTGYEREEREKLINSAFDKFKNVFGYYPTSVGAWWIDAYSLSYMEKKYGITGTLIVADQYSTDNYQIWGQYFSTPYYPDNKNALHPAQSTANKIPVVLVQWASRDPLNGYGNGVYESTFSLQANDYVDFHKLDTNYFTKLLDLYTINEFNGFGQAVVGLENTYKWDKYKNEYKNQIEVLSKKRNQDNLKILTLKDFAMWYKNAYPDISPTSVVVSDDLLGSFHGSSNKKVVWFMNPYFRAGWFLNENGSVFRDIRQYIEGEEEICFQKRCDSVNFATFATRVLDEVTYGNKWVIDEGKITNFKTVRDGDKVILTYLNEAGKLRTIEFLPRDILVNGKASSIDGAILNAIKQDNNSIQKSNVETGNFSWSIVSVLSKLIRLLLFLVFIILIPGIVLTNKLADKDSPFLEKIFLSTVVGFVSLTVIFYITGLLNLRVLIYLYILINFLIFLKLKILATFKLNYVSLLVILAGTIFQVIPTFRSGLNFPYGLGFWGPNTHDGIWHISLINQLIKHLPAQNPIFAGTTLKNYHFFYDLMVAATAFFTNLPISDLVFRLYPIIFSLLLGIGTYFLAIKLFRNKIASIFSLYFVYFSGSFGWIVDYMKNKTFGGESAFWANQSISFNLNPPFAISLLIIIACLLILKNIRNLKSKLGVLISVLLLGSLIGFKSYGGVLAIGALGIVALVNLFKKQFIYLYITALSAIFSLCLFISNFEIGQKLLIFSPFWLIHSMIDSPDRVGWVRLSLARIAGVETNNPFKFISSEIVGLAIFIFGNLGMRFLSLLSLVKIKSILKDNILLFIFVFSLLSFIIPTAFIQSGNPWNIIQFSYYGLYISAIVSGAIVSSIIFKSRRFILKVLLFVIIILAPINSITTASYYTGNLPHARIDKKELEALEFLSKMEDGIVLTYPYDEKLKNKLPEPRPLFAYDSTAYVSAISKKSTYLEDEPQNQILLNDYKKRMILTKDFFLTQDKKFLNGNKIKYIYLLKIFNKSLDLNKLNLTKIFENSEVIILRTND